MSSAGIATHNALRSPRSLAGLITAGVCLCLLFAGCASRQAAVSDSAFQPPIPSSSSLWQGPPFIFVPPLAVPPHAAVLPKRADFEKEPKSADAKRLADWVVDSGDNHGMPFLIVDKKDARAFAFNAEGRLRGAAPVLLGLSRGDDTVPGIGDRELSNIRPEERTTPAGRFVAALGRDWNGKDILWVDYEIALSLHRVITSNASERRLERLTSPTTSDNRISFGCINVPVKFYDDVVKPVFTGTYGVVYILPETRSNNEVFASYYDVDDVPRQVQLSTSTMDQGASAIDLIQSLDPG